MATIGIDIGGTTTRAGLVDQTGRLLIAQRLPTPRSADAFFDKLCARIASLRESEAAHGPGVSALGVALPGLIDSDRGRLVRSVNLPFLEGNPVRHELAARTGLPVMLTTDADAATWGEYSARSPRAARFVHLRLGTGVACGVVLDGKLQPTGQPRATHWNVLVVDRGPSAIACPCGLRGCLETIASGPAIEQRAMSLGLTPSAFTGEGRGEGRRSRTLRDLQEAFVQRDTGARALIDEITRGVITAISNLRSQISNLESVCLGGGVLSALPCLFEATSTQWAQHPDAGSASLYLARLGDNAGVIGAAMLACT